ncbi:hypothetical protein U1Q18_039774, partial [Sarracenia purpurea var. burkii]
MVLPMVRRMRLKTTLEWRQLVQWQRLERGDDGGVKEVVQKGAATEVGGLDLCGGTLDLVKKPDLCGGDLVGGVSGDEEEEIKDDVGAAITCSMTA